MLKVIFIDHYGNSRIKDMHYPPRIGDTVPLFHQHGKVENVVWFPETIYPEMKDLRVDILVTLN